MAMNMLFFLLVVCIRREDITERRLMNRYIYEIVYSVVYATLSDRYFCPHDDI